MSRWEEATVFHNYKTMSQLLVKLPMLAAPDSSSKLGLCVERCRNAVKFPFRQKFASNFISVRTQLLEWIIERATARVIPVVEDPIQAFRGSGKKGLATQLLKEHRRDRQREHASQKDSFVFDTSALLALPGDEPWADRVETFFLRRKRTNVPS